MRRVPISFGSFGSVRFGSVHSFIPYASRRVASLFVVFVRSIDRTTYRLDVRVVVVVVVLIAAVPATKVEVFADVANIIVSDSVEGCAERRRRRRVRPSVCFPSPGSVRWVWI